MEVDVKPGIRVVRGPDWKWGNQDGGEGHVGTVVEVKTGDTPADNLTASRVVLVQWDNGNRCNYRCGVDGKHDLIMYDNGPISVLHSDVVCDSCRENGIQGMRWKCMKCYDFDLCTVCYMAGKHDLTHSFHRQDSPETPKVVIPPRDTDTRVQAKGLFPNALVSRGHDWIWGDQDVGGTGKLGAVNGWEKDTYRSVAEVVWSHSNKKNVYRIGHKGKVDIKADTPGDGLLYYPGHLPVLGKPHSVETVVEEKNVVQLVSGDSVRIQLEVEAFKLLQDGHGGWNDVMVNIMNKVGTVHTILDNGDIRVKFQGNKTWTLNPAAVTKLVQFSKGDVIKVIDDMSTVYTLQENHGGWVDDMALALGQVGRVSNVFPTGDVRASVNGRIWTFNPACLVLAPDEDAPEITADEDITVPQDMDLQLKLLSLLENPAVIVAAAANGDVSIMREFLTKHPTEVNTKAAGKAAIHCASVAGNMTILKCLLEFNADLEIEDEDGDRPLHLCAYGDEDEAARLLIQNGANLNALNGQGATPIIIAAAKGHASALKALLESPTVDLSVQDLEGNNALHHGVLGQRHTVVATLLDAKFDIELVNFRLFTPVHDAARIGFLSAMELFIKHSPLCVSLRKDDGYTPLHLAALNNHLEVLTTILDSELCDINITTNELQTPLHIAVHQGHGAIVERLIGFGANLNTQDKDGDTPLHIALMRETVDALDTPQLQKVRKNFNIEEGSAKSGVMACFLVQEGSELYMQNHKGNTPLLICSPDVAALVTKFVDENKGEKSSFRGSLCSMRGTGAVMLLSPTSNNPPVSSFDKIKQVSPPPPSPSQNGDTPTKHVSPPLSHSVTGGGATPVPVGGHVDQLMPEEECVLCDGKIDIVFKPCNHSVVCRQCSARAKKCPTCKVRVTRIEDIITKCGMCEEEDATVTLKPCGHKFCPGCCYRPKRCIECKTVIELKIGLPDSYHETTANARSSGEVEQTSSSATFCEICCERPRNTALTCGHQFCNICSMKVDKCPICRKFIQHRIQLFL